MFKPNFLRLDIQYFSSDEVGGGSGDPIEDFDLAAFDEKFAQETEEVEETHEEPVEEAEEVEETEEVEENQGEEEETPEVIHDEDTSKRNQAFADMRKKAEENEKYAAVIKQLAEQHGMSPEDVIKQYEEARLEAEAKEQNVPVDVLKRLRSLETENSQAKQEAFISRFESQIEKTMAKYNASEDDVRKTFEYANENGIDFENSRISFEAAYKMAHLDTITAKAVEEAKQKELSSKRKRQRDAGIPNGEGSSQTGQDDLLESATKEAKSIVADW